MTESPWMTTRQIAEYAGRHQETVLIALKRRLLVGSQAGPGCSWRAMRGDVDSWIESGCPYRITAKHKPRKLRAA